MTTTTFKPIAARQAPVNTEGVIPWMRSNLFGDARTTAATFMFGGLMLWFIPQFIDWAIFRAYWLADSDACRADGVGACWGVITEKYRLIIFGRYPFEEQWVARIGCHLNDGHVAGSQLHKGLLETLAGCAVGADAVRLFRHHVGGYLGP